MVADFKLLVAFETGIRFTRLTEMTLWLLMVLLSGVTVCYIVVFFFFFEEV